MKRRRTLRLRKRQLLARERKLRSRGFFRIAGVDEAGRGPLAGPVVACACLLRRTDISSRVDDSKRLSAREREEAFEEICRKAFVGVGIVDERRIDALNIHRASKLAMELAVKNLGLDPDYVLVDGVTRIDIPCLQETIVKGDARAFSIAAASVVAKVTRDHIMEELDELYPAYEFKRHKGYGTRRHKSALRHFGPSIVHRMSYAPVKESAAAAGKPS